MRRKLIIVSWLYLALSACATAPPPADRFTAVCPQPILITGPDITSETPHKTVVYDQCSETHVTRANHYHPPEHDFVAELFGAILQGIFEGMLHVLFYGR